MLREILEEILNQFHRETDGSWWLAVETEEGDLQDGAVDSILGELLDRLEKLLEDGEDSFE